MSKSWKDYYTEITGQEAPSVSAHPKQNIERPAPSAVTPAAAQKPVYNPLDDIMRMYEPKTPTVQTKQYVTGNAALDAWRSSVNTLANERKEKEAKAKAEAEQKEYKQLQSQLDRIDANRAYVTTTEQNDALEKERASVVQRMREIDGGTTSPAFGERVKKLFAGTGLERLGSDVGAIRGLYEAGQKGRTAQYQQAYDELQPQIARAQTAYYEMRKLYGEAGATAEYNALKDLQQKSDAYKKVLDENIQQRATAATSEMANSLTETGGAKLEEAKQGLSPIGRVGVDAASAGLNMLYDAALGRFGGSTLSNAAMGLRSFGQTAQAAEASGADIDRQIGAGAAAAAKTVITNGLVDGLAGLYGKGAADDIIEMAVGKLGKTDAGRNALRALAKSAGEGVEELVDAKLDPLVSLVYDNGEALKQKYGSGWQGYKEAAADDLYSALIGFTLGAAGQGVSAARGAYARANVELTDGAKADANATAEAAPTQQTASQQTAPAASAESRALMESILAGGRVNTTTANAILADQQLTQAFTELTGISLSGNTADMRTQISGGAREYAYSQLQTSREESARVKARENLPAEMARQNEQLAALSQEEAARDADWTQRREEMENYGSYDSYVRGIVRNGGSFAEAGEIARTPELRATWEKITGQTLPDSTNKARDMVTNYRADVAMPQRSAQQPQTRANVQEGNLAPTTPANVKQGGSDELNSVLNLNSRETQAAAPAEVQKNTAPTQETEKKRLSMADYADKNSSVWNNLDYNDTAAQTKAMHEAHERMTAEGRVVEIPESTQKKTAESFPDLRGMKKSERTPILKQKMAELKSDIRQFLNGLKGGSFEFEVSGNVLEAKLYDTGIKEVLEKITQDKANMLNHSDLIFDNAEYLYSLPDYDGNPNVYRWNYFYTPAQIGDSTVGVRIAVRDMKQTDSGRPESQIYNWGIKKTPALDGGSPEKTSLSTGASSAGVIDTTSERYAVQKDGFSQADAVPVSDDISSDTSIPMSGQNVNGNFAGNASVFEPTYNQDAKPYTKEKLSQFWTNTLRETESAAGVSEDVSRPLSYLPKTEKQSLAEAASRLHADKQGTIEKLASSEAWSGVQVDAAAKIGDELYREGAKSGNYEAYTAWRKVMEEHITEGGRGVQALAKYTRRTGENALSSIASAIDNSDLTPQQRTTLINNIGEYATRFDKIARGIPDTDTSAKASGAPSPELVSLIEDMARTRGTWTFTDGTYSALLKKQSNAYLKEYAYQQLLGMGNDKLAHVSVADKVKAAQSMAQLTSVATFARNIGGNVTFGVVDTMTQDGLGVALDFALSKATGKRTVGLDKGWASSEARKGAIDAMQKSILEVAGDVDMDGSVNRYGQPSGRAFKMDGSPLERFTSRWQQLLAYSLTTSDKFSRGAIEAEQIRGLNAIKNSGLTDEEMQSLAQAMADYRLFQNHGIAYAGSKWTHDFLNLVGFGGKVSDENLGAGRQGGFGLGDFVNTYPGVPANLGVKVLEYSPANIVKGGAELVDVIIKAKQGKLDVVKQQQAVMDLSRGLAGTPIFALFAALAKAGFIRNWDDEDDPDIRAQNAAEGKTGIQFNLNGALRYLQGDKSLEWREGDKLDSIGWLEPINGFMAVGSLIAKEPEDASVWAYAGDIAEGAVQAFLDIPVMSNIANMVDTFRYSNADSLPGKLGEAAVTYGGDLLTSFLPSPVRGIAKGLDPYYRDTAGDTAGETALNRIKLAIPGLRETLPVKLDNFGQPKMYSGNTAERLLDTLVNPGTRTTIRQSEASKMLEELYKATGDASIYPDRKAPASIKLGDDAESTKLTSAEKRVYQKTAGNKAEEMITSLADSPLFDTANDELKTSAVKDLLSFSEDTAKKQYAQGKAAEFESRWDKVFDTKLPDVPDYMLAKNALDTAKSKPQKANYDYIDDLIGKYNTLSPGSKELLLDSGTNIANLLYADSKGIGSKAWYDTHNAIDGTGAVAAASAVSRNFKGGDKEKLDALRTMNSYTAPDKETGKQSAIVRRYEAAMNYGVSFDDWTRLEETIVDMFGSGTPNKSEIYAAAKEALPNVPQYKVYNLYKKDSANEKKVDIYDMYFADLYEPTGGKPESESDGVMYKTLLDMVGLSTGKK